MDRYFEEIQGCDDDFFWYEIGTSSPPSNRSAFTPYMSLAGGENMEESTSGVNGLNMNKRMIAFMKKTWTTRNEAPKESKRWFGHVISERLRRDKEKKGYLALHSLLPPATKNEKQAILRTAAKEIEELKRYKEVLVTRNQEIEHKLSTSVASEDHTKIRNNAKITIKILNPYSCFDYMIPVLKCLKSYGSKITSVKSKFSAREYTAIVDIETHIEPAEVEKAVERALQEFGRSFLREEGC